MAYTFLKKKNNAKSTLNGAILSGVTSLVVTSASPFPTSGNFTCTLWDKSTYPDPSDDPNMEIILVTAVSGTTFTITRAQESTTGVAHSSGHAIEQLITAAQVVELETRILAVAAGGFDADVNLASTGVLYFGDSATDGSWRILRSGNNLSIQRRESGVWNEKTNWSP